MCHSVNVTAPDPDLAALADAVRAAAENRARHQQLDAQLTAAAALADARSTELAELQRRLHVEQADVLRLENLSPTRIWATLRGDTADRLEMEQAEADAAALAVAGAQARLDSAIADAARVSGEREILRDAGISYGVALARYEAAVRASGGRHAAELAEIAEQLGEATALQREIGEAVAALRVASNALDEALASLDSAGGWSTYDAFFGGGFVADMVKHSNISDATAAFTRVNRALERLSTDLADLGASAVDGVEISDELAVFDVLFDNIFSDWMVLDRITQAQSGAQKLRDHLAQLAQHLATDANQTATRIETLLGRREAILTAV